jgi:hypothetical protein
MSKKLYVGNISFQTTNEELMQAFGQYGTVTNAQVVTDRETGRSRGFAFVEMADGGDEAVTAMNGALLAAAAVVVTAAAEEEAVATVVEAAEAAAAMAAAGAATVAATAEAAEAAATKANKLGGPGTAGTARPIPGRR